VRIGLLDKEECLLPRVPSCEGTYESRHDGYVNGAVPYLRPHINESGSTSPTSYEIRGGVLDVTCIVWLSRGATPSVSMIPPS